MLNKVICLIKNMKSVLLFLLFSIYESRLTESYYQLLPFFTYIPSNRRISSNKPPSVFELTSKRHGDTIITPSYIKLCSNNFSSIESIHSLNIKKFEFQMVLSSEVLYKDEKKGGMLFIWFYTDKYANFNHVPGYGFADKFKGLFISIKSRMMVKSQNRMKTLIKVHQSIEYKQFKEEELNDTIESINGCLADIFNDDAKVKFTFRYDAIGFIDIYYNKIGNGPSFCFSLPIKRDILNKDFKIGISTRSGNYGNFTYKEDFKIYEIIMFNNDKRLKDNYKYNKTYLNEIEKNYYKSYHTVDLVEKYSNKKKPLPIIRDFNTINKATYINDTQFTLFDNYMNNISSIYQTIEMYYKLKGFFESNYSYTDNNRTSYNISISNYEDSLLSRKKRFIYSTNLYTNSIINILSNFQDKIAKCLLIFPIILFLMIISIYYKLNIKLNH